MPQPTVQNPKIFKTQCFKTHKRADLFIEEAGTSECLDFSV